ncbi:hypothetical protein CmeUKMEL1_10985 [Cryptosporidium meleagridis]|uniref:Uncharacterized protein n=1 Tax=Cryptosporidium meleagridis TaxID=93969 RepID=A0A2P4Z2C4_9CRYT|nr:hypothetical protein CmeUKMEL1_10985 [Cryptosporidium meleagridis]
MSLSEKSIKELFNELVKVQVKNHLQNINNEKNLENLIKRIEDKVWTKILYNKTKKNPMEDTDYISFLDSALSNILVQSRIRPESMDNMKMIIDQRSKLVETQMFCFLPLFILSHNMIKQYYQNSSGSYILHIMFILIGSLDSYNLDFWENQCLAKVYHSDFTWRLNSIMQRNLSDSLIKDTKENIELNFNFKTYLPTFSSLMFKSIAFNKNNMDFWMDVISDFALGIVTFKNLASNLYLNEESLFNNELTQLTEDMEEIEISREANKIAEVAFGNDNFHFTDQVTKGTESKNSIIPKKTMSVQQSSMNIRKNRNSLLASFMGNSDDELDELEELEFYQEYMFSKEKEGKEKEKEEIEEEEKEVEELKILDNQQSQQSNSTISMERNKNEKSLDSKSLNLSSFNYFDGLSKSIKGKMQEIEDENYRICNLSKVKLPSLLRRVSGRRQIQYNNKYLGFSWDQQYLSLNKANKIFNESILSVLTTERIKNCTIVSPNSEISSTDGHIWVKLDSLMKLFQGLDSEEFSVYPRHHRVREYKKIELLECYTILIDEYNISLELMEEFGELSPWMNNHYQGDKFIYTRTGTNIKKNDTLDPRNDLMNTKNSRDEQIFLSQDLVSKICLFGTKVHYLRSLAELLTVLGEMMNNQQKLEFITKNEDLRCNQIYIEESMVSIKILGKAILEFLHMYFGDIELCFSKFNYGNDHISNLSSTKTSSYLNLIALLDEFSPAFEILVSIFKLRSYSGREETRSWKIPHGYSLLSYIYTCLWQFQINPYYIVSNNYFINVESQKSTNNRIDKGIYSSGYILSVIYKSLQGGIFKDKLDYITSNKESSNLELKLKANLSLNKSILGPVVPVLLRILMIKRISFNKTLQVTAQNHGNTALAKTDQLKRQDLSMFFSDVNVFTQDFKFNNRIHIDSNSEPELDDHDLESQRVPVPKKNFQQANKIKRITHIAIMEYLKKHELDFNKVYEIYFKSLDQAFEHIIRLEFNVNEYIDLAFEIGGLLADKSYQGNEYNTGTSIQEEFEFLKELIQDKVKKKKFMLTRQCDLVSSEERGIGNLKLRVNNHTAYIKQLNNYISVNGCLQYENLIKLVFGLDLDLSQYFRKQINISEISSTFEIQKIGKEQGEEEFMKLFQIIVLLETISKRFIDLKNFVGRIALYIWCRKYTTDYNLYIKFSKGYLYDSFSEELQKLIWDIERNISRVYGTIQVIQEYLVMLFRRFDLKTTTKSRNYTSEVSYDDYSFDDKWLVVQKYYNGKLLNDLSLSEKGFIYFITCLVCQICLVLSDLLSKTGSFRDLPKRPSSFSPNISEDQDQSDSQRNVILEFVNNWKSNSLEEKVAQYFTVYKSLKNYISGNKNIFSAENSHILYYINS